MKGKFFCLEGGEGSGKSLLLRTLSERLRDLGFSVLTTREPGGIPISESIRAIIVDPRNTLMDARTEALLYSAARRQLIVQKIIPALEAGDIVLCDRYVYSSWVYQGYARGLGMPIVKEINDFATEGCMPDVTLYLDIDPEVGLSRIMNNADREVNRLDLEALEFHKKVREGYRMLVHSENNFVMVDAENSPEEVAEDAWGIIQRCLFQ